VQVSTDYVFAGNEPGERVESDATGPISAYGTTKLEGEMLVAAATPKHFIVRTAWLYGYVGKNFVKTMKRLGESHDVVTVVDDQLGNPTSANDLAYEILKIALTDNYGIYHATNNGTCSWAQFAQAIMEGFKLDCKVEPVTSEQYKAANPQSADRPAFSSLTNKHLQDTVGDEMRPWQDALASYIQNFDELNG
jgi:dTDP-4-dehydrorhamnose reductase